MTSSGRPGSSSIKVYLFSSNSTSMTSSGWAPRAAPSEEPLGPLEAVRLPAVAVAEPA